MRMGKIAAAAATAAFGACAFAGPAGADNFVNATPITVSDNASASPYPSPISVSGFCGGSVTFAASGSTGSVTPTRVTWTCCSWRREASGRC